MFYDALNRFKHRNITLGEILEEHYIAYSHISDGTITRYRCELRRWVRLIGDIPASKITEIEFNKFRGQCVTSNMSNSSTEGSVKVVKALLRYARDRGWIDRLPVWGKPLRLEEPEPQPATMVELTRLYENCAYARYPGSGEVSPANWMRSFLVLEYWTGIRGQDLVWKLEWNDIKDDCIRFRASKTSKRHIFPLHPVVTEHLDLVTGMSARMVFGVRSLQRVNNELGRLCEYAGIRKLTTSNIRQACFTEWVLAGEVAGKIVHGSGLPRVLKTHYLGRLTILDEAAPNFRWPEPMAAIAQEPATLQVRGDVG